MRSSSRTSAAAATTPKSFSRRANGRCAISIAATARSSTASGFSTTISCSRATSFASAIRTWRSSTICRRRFPIRTRCCARRRPSIRTRAATSPIGPPDHESVLETYEPTTITHRRGQSRFLEPPEEEDVDVSLPKVGRAAANLCRLAFELAKATDVVTLANVALDGLFEGTQVDAGAVLLQARRPTPKPTGRQPGSDRLAERFAASVPSRFAVPCRRP